MKQITAKQYARIHPFLPIQRGNVRISNITFINATLYVMENGCKWRALPERFGKWYTVYARFRSGALERLFAALREPSERRGGGQPINPSQTRKIIYAYFFATSMFFSWSKYISFNDLSSGSRGILI